MQLSFSQQMKMSQQMKLAPRMIQSMEILQLPLMALKERIDQELSENPLLEDPIGESVDAPEASSCARVPAGHDVRSEVRPGSVSIYTSAARAHATPAAGRSQALAGCGKRVFRCSKQLKSASCST